MTIQELAKKLGKTEQTIRRWIKQEKVDAKLVDGKYIIDETKLTDYLSKDDLTSQDKETTSQPNTDFLMQELEHFKRENEELRQELSQVRERSDVIIMQLTRQLEQNQRLLEYHQSPFWRRWFGKRRKAIESERQ